MAKQFAAELSLGERVASPFVARRKIVREFRNKPGKYLSLVLGDRSGEIPAVIWEGAEDVAETFAEGDLVYVEGVVEEYQGKPQVRIERLERRAAEDVELTDFVERAPRDAREMIEELRAAARSVENPYLRRLLEEFLHDPQVCAGLLDMPAAKGLHHAYLGGLAEHITACLKIAEAVCETHPELNRDLVVAGIILHDAGKLEELTFGQTIDYTPQGRLLGHIALGFLDANRRMDRIKGFPEELRLQLSHIILAHHNSPEFGSPVRPMTAEAVAVHFIENCDAQIKRFVTQINAARQSGELFTEFDRLLERYLYAGPPPEAKDEPNEQEEKPQGPQPTLL